MASYKKKKKKAYKAGGGAEKTQKHEKERSGKQKTKSARAKIEASS